jgi:hypothetical protein
MDAVAWLWGGELPPSDNLDAANELLRVLVMGLWNRLTRHQERDEPFWLMRIDAPATREGLVQVALIRREEVVGFIQGLFGKEEDLALPEQARRSVEALAEAGGLFTGVHRVAGDPTKPASGRYHANPTPHPRVDESLRAGDP